MCHFPAKGGSAAWLRSLGQQNGSQLSTLLLEVLLLLMPLPTQLATATTKASQRCPINFPICHSDGDCVIPACLEECDWQHAQHFIYGYNDAVGAKCIGNYQVETENKCVGDADTCDAITMKTESKCTGDADTCDAIKSSAFDEKKSTDSDSCQDSNGNCEIWADHGQCQANPSYMKTNCAASCGACNSNDAHPRLRPDCQDHHHRCFELSREGACHYNHSAMMKECPRSCRVCGENDPCMPNASDAGVLPRPGALQKLIERIIKTENVTVLSSDPFVLLLHNIISDEHVNRIREILSKNWERSRVGGAREKRTSEKRTSEQQWCKFHCASLPPIEELTRRVEGIVGAPRRNFEDLQALRYQAGQYYKPHHDYLADHVFMPVGPRVLTLFLYLNDVKEGGTTDFPELNISVPPQKGSILLWPSVLDSNPFVEDARTRHEGMPPKGDSVKLAVNFWVHQYDFRTYSEQFCLLNPRPRNSYNL